MNENYKLFMDISSMFARLVIMVMTNQEKNIFLARSTI